VRGYLSHIAAKVAGTRPAVRPRVPSLFEPVKGAQFLNVPNIATERRDSASAQEPGQLEQDRFVDALSHATERTPQEVGQRPQANKADVTLKDAEHSGAVVQRNELRRIEDRSQPVKAGTTQAEIEPALGVQRAETAAHREAVKPPVVPLSRQRETDEQPPERIEVRAPRSENRTTRVEVERVERETVRTVHGRDESERDKEHVRPAIGRDSSRREPAPEFVSRIAHVSQQVASERRTPVREIVNEAPAPVQVTIGRLIVEAVMPPSAPAPPPIRHAPGPRLSLDDYLRQRGGRA